MAKIINKSKKVIIGLSGGIDSAVAAALLKKQGFKVVGVFFRLWQEPCLSECGHCPFLFEKKAYFIADVLGVDFYVLDLQKEFKKKIVDKFLQEFKNNNTPNPCVVCNKEIKFNFLLKEMEKIKADYISTGHYARPKKQNMNYQLLKGKDKEKDQSYFLWKLGQKELKNVLFPLGNYTKEQVREMAKKFDFPLFENLESQEICFIKTTINDFLKKFLKPKPGKIKDTKGRVLGEHKGLFFYTIGQRKGIELSGGPYFVTGKDLKNNVLIISKNEKDLYRKELIAKDISWISGENPKFPLGLEVKIRYRQETSKALVIEYKKGELKVVFSKPQRAVTPGQSVVFYKGEELLGGGIIQ